MTVLLELEPDLEACVTIQAKERGLPVPQYLHGLIMQAAQVQAAGGSAPELLGWPAGFFEETYGALAADPLERLPQPEVDARELLA